MDYIREVLEDPIKSKIMSSSLYKDKITPDELCREVNTQGAELHEALDSLTSSNLLIKNGSHYRKTLQGWKVSYALKGYEEAAKHFTGIDAEIPLSGFILDIGCGGGAYLRELGRYAANTIGVDVDTEFLHIASLKSGQIVIKADAHFLPFKDSAFDLIVCYLTVPYLENEARAMAEASRVLNENGTIQLRLHGLGCHLRAIFGKPERKKGIRGRIGAGMIILNTFIYWLTDRKLKRKGRVFETFQTKSKIEKILRKYQIETIKSNLPQGRFLGVPVFIDLKGMKR